MKKVNVFLLFGVFITVYALLFIHVLFFKFVSPAELLQTQIAHLIFFDS